MYRAPITVDSRQIVLNKKGLSPPPGAVSAGSREYPTTAASVRDAAALLRARPCEEP